MVGKYIKYKGLHIFATGVLVLVILLSVAGCQAETVTTTVTEKSTITSTITKTETSTVKNTATVTETKTVTATPTTTTTKTSTTSATSTTTTSIVANDQPQQITSDNGKVQILKHELIDGWSTSPYGMYVSGVVKNLTSANVTAEITIQFYDKDKALLGTESLKLDIVASRSLPFQIFAGDIGVGAGTSYGHFVTSYVIAVTTVS
jgi:cytoskeletal protein RodZ